MVSRKIQFASPAGKIGWIILGILAVIFAFNAAIAVIIFLLLMTALFWVGLILSIARYRRDTVIPFSTIRGASQGYAKLKGRIQGETQQAPLSKQDCVYWELRLLRYTRSRTAATPGWNEVASAQSAHDFVTLDDGTGVCVLQVDANGWELSENQSREFDEAGGIGDFATYFDPDLRARLQTEARWRIDEYCIRPTQTVYATGLFKTVASDQTPYDDTSLDQHERMGDAASAFSKWVVKDFGPAYRASITKAQRTWTAYIKQHLLGSGDASEPIELGNQMIHSLISGSEGKSYIAVTVTNRKPASQDRADRKLWILQFFLGWLWLSMIVLVTQYHYPETFNAIIKSL